VNQSLLKNSLRTVHEEKRGKGVFSRQIIVLEAVQIIESLVFGPVLSPFFKLLY
jgi:hypothetical protein